MSDILFSRNFLTFSKFGSCFISEPLQSLIHLLPPRSFTEENQARDQQGTVEFRHKRPLLGASSSDDLTAECNRITIGCIAIPVVWACAVESRSFYNTER